MQYQNVIASQQSLFVKAPGAVNRYQGTQPSGIPQQNTMTALNATRNGVKITASVP